MIRHFNTKSTLRDLYERTFVSGPGGMRVVYKHAPWESVAESPYGYGPARTKAKARKARKTVSRKTAKQVSRKVSRKSSKLSKHAKMLAHMAKMRRARKSPKTRGSR